MKYALLILVAVFAACSVEAPQERPILQKASQGGELIYGADDRNEA
ncbi:MAG: hypothetical protein ACI9OJ_002930, partial [Myxococcota bacterium]